MQQRPDADVESSLKQLTEGACQMVPGAEYAGITLTTRHRQIVTVAATHRYAELLDDVQGQYREGPCLSAAWEHHTIRINDLASDGRWPQYQRKALEQTPIRSIMSFRLFGDAQTEGALNYFAQSANAFDEESLEAGLVFATHTAVVWNMLRRDEQLLSALRTRDIIGQAKGMLMERFDIDAATAFVLLRKLSQESNIRIVEIAQRVMDAK